MLRKKKTSIPSTDELQSLQTDVNQVVSEESHQMTLNRPFGKDQMVETLSLTNEYHLTIQIKNSSLRRRELSLLLDVLNYQAVYYGLNLNMILAMYELYFRLLGNKREASEVLEPRIRLTCTVSELILQNARNLDWSLWSGICYDLDPKLRKILKEVGLMSKRTYGSRFKTWRPEKFLSVRIVPVDIQFLKRNKRSQPYSSYTKGYGESHPSAHRQKTRPNSETDGSGESPAQVYDQMIFNRCTDPIHVQSEFLLLWYEDYLSELDT